ncbi:EamA/RhaT family transporter, partial [Gordonia sp. OPL2]
MVAISSEINKSDSLAPGYAGALVTVFIWATWI